LSAAISLLHMRRPPDWGTAHLPAGQPGGMNMEARMARSAALPVLTAENGLSRYMEEIRRFPMLEPHEEYMLAKNWREHGDREASSPAICGSSPRSPWAIAAMACRFPKSFPKAMSA
jgi:hypothetical protein